MKTRLGAMFGLMLVASIEAQVLPNDAVVGGKTISDWSVEWYRWVYSLPTHENPLLDQDGSHANNGQPLGPVFFLAGVWAQSGVAHRVFSVPEGRYLLFPLLNVESDNVYTVPPLTVPELRDINAGYIRSTTNLYASIDGVPLTNLFAHRVKSPVFNFVYANPDNLASYLANQPITGLIDPMVSDGYWLMLEPLPAGQPHTISFGGTFGPPIDFTLVVTDVITVVPATSSAAVHDLVPSGHASDRPPDRKRRLRDEPREAERASARVHRQAGIRTPRDFQSRVRDELPRRAGAELDQAARAIREHTVAQSQ